MLIGRRPSGSFLDGQPSGNPKRMTCMFHAWQYDLKGNCVYISREKEGYQDRLGKENVGLRRLRCEVKFGGVRGVGPHHKPHPLQDEGGKRVYMLRDSLQTQSARESHYYQ